MAAQRPFGIQTDLLQHPDLTIEITASIQNYTIGHSDGRSPSYNQLDATVLVHLLSVTALKIGEASERMLLFFRERRQRTSLQTL